MVRKLETRARFLPAGTTMWPAGCGAGWSSRVRAAGRTLTLYAAPIAAAAFATLATAQRAQPAAHAGEVAGVRLGMDASQTEAALRQRGYAIEGRETAPSFKERVRIALGDAVLSGGGSVSKLNGVKGRESVQVSFVQTATGPSASQVWYRAPEGQVPAADAIASMRSRLGPPVAKRSGPTGAVWCKDGPNPRWCDGATPSTEISSGWGTTSIMMKAGTGAQTRADAQVAAAARASNRVKPSF